MAYQCWSRMDRALVAGSCLCEFKKRTKPECACTINGRLVYNLAAVSGPYKEPVSLTSLVELPPHTHTHCGATLCLSCENALRVCGQAVLRIA